MSAQIKGSYKNNELDYMLYGGKRVEIRPITPRQLKALKHVVQKISDKIVTNEVRKGSDPFSVLATFVEKWHEHVGDVWEELFEDIIMTLSLFSGVDEETLWDVSIYEHIEYINKLLAVNKSLELKKNLLNIRTSLESLSMKQGKS